MTLVVAGAAAVYTLRIADDCLVLSHRLAQWSSWAPTLEDDVALTNIALDLLGQARAMYARTAELDGTGRSEDDYAFLRDEREFVNCLLVEQENGDFATTIVRQLLCSTYQLAAVAGAGSVDRRAGRGHRGQGGQGDGVPPRPRHRLDTPSRRRHRREPPAAWRARSPRSGRSPQSCSRAMPSPATRPRRGVGPDPEELRPEWDAYVNRVLGDATLVAPEVDLETDRRPARSAHRAFWVHAR